jgi:hypothetical protein
MKPIEKLDALVAGLAEAEIRALPLERRQRLARALRQIADLADPPKADAPKAGILSDLRDGRSHN